MSSTATVRPRTEEDLDACIAVLHRVHENEGYPRGTDDFRVFLANDSVQKAWVTELDGRVVGHVAVNKPSETDLAVSMWRQKHPDDEHDSIAVLARLFVLPESRKGGAAKALVEEATASSTMDGVRLVLFVLVANQGAIRLYDRLGWERFETSVFRYGDEKELEMEAICFASPSVTN